MEYRICQVYNSIDSEKPQFRPKLGFIGDNGLTMSAPSSARSSTPSTGRLPMGFDDESSLPGADAKRAAMAKRSAAAAERQRQAVEERSKKAKAKRTPREKNKNKGASRYTFTSFRSSLSPLHLSVYRYSSLSLSRPRLFLYFIVIKMRAPSGQP